MYRRAFCASFTLFVLTFAPRAFASDPYPEEIRAQLMLAEKPLCTICHETLIGGLMTVNKPFGRTLQQKYGLRFLDAPGLRAAIMRMQQDGDDSDGDGTSDTAELQQGTDPNVPQGGGPIAEEARYGCYCSAAGGASAPTAAGAAWLSGLLLSVGRRRRATLRRGVRKT
jgi:MYXO-CTERM domain-containing protein